MVRNVQPARFSMDPAPILPVQWNQIAHLLITLPAFVGLALTAAFAFVLGRVVIPAVGGTGSPDEDVRPIRWVLYPVAILSLAVMLVALARALVLSVEIIRYIYPRFLI